MVPNEPNFADNSFVAASAATMTAGVETGAAGTATAFTRVGAAAAGATFGMY